MSATATATRSIQAYIDHVNPQWVRLLNLLQMQTEYGVCSGAELHTAAGDVILDFLSGYCVHNAGHNHPAIIEALHGELDRRGPVMLQSHVPDLAGELARRLCGLAGGGLEKVFFASSGSEGVEAAIKFSRATTGREGLLYCGGAFHGLTCGALSLMSDGFWRGRFGPMLNSTASIPFGDIAALHEKLKSRAHAAFIVEPDMVILAKALSGGLVPVSAVLMTDKVYRSVYDSLKRSIIHTSTFSENALAMRAGLATLDVLIEERLGPRAMALGDTLRDRLRQELSGYEMVEQIRGLGMLSGIVFRAPKSLRLRLSFESFRRVHPAMFGQVMVMRMFRDQRVLTQMCGNNFMVLKVAPPLVIGPDQIERFVRAIREVIHQAHHSTEFWVEALGLARRALNV